MSECRPCQETRCEVTPDTLIYSLEGLPDQPPPPQPPGPVPQVGNDAVFFATSCGAGLRLVYTGTPPSWITIGTFSNRVTGGANAFYRDTKTAANITAQAELNSWVNSVLVSGSLKCSGFDETDMWAWWKADAITGLNDEDVVPQWDDSSGLGNHLTRGVPYDIWTSNGPFYRTNRVNGLPAVNFDTGWFTMTTFFSGFTEGDIFVVLKADNDPENTYHQSGFWRLSADLSYDFYAISDNRRPWVSFATANRTIYPPDSVPPPLLSSWHTLNMSSRTNEWIGRVNGVALATNAVNTVAWPSGAGFGVPMIGNSGPRDLFDPFFYGDIAEIIFFDKVQDATNRAMILDYFSTKYGI